MSTQSMTRCARSDGIGEEAGGDDRGRAAQLARHPRDEPFNEADVAEDDAGAQRFRGVRADGALRQLQVDAVQLGRPPGQRLQREAQPGRDRRADHRPLRVDAGEGHRRAEADDDRGAAVAVVGGEVSS